eukprot:757919-Hanusia_phi.AAC.7
MAQKSGVGVIEVEIVLGRYNAGVVKDGARGDHCKMGYVVSGVVSTSRIGVDGGVINDWVGVGVKQFMGSRCEVQRAHQ